MSGPRHQRTYRIEGCRVRMTWHEPGWGGFRIKVTDPTGDEAHELDLAARLAGGIVTEALGLGITMSLNVGPLQHIDDHA